MRARERMRFVWREATGNLGIVFHTWQSLIRSLRCEFICVLLALKRGHRLKTKNSFFIQMDTQFSVPTFMPCPLFCVYVCVFAWMLAIHCTAQHSTALAIIVIKINVSLLFCFVLLLLMYAKLLINMNSNASTVTDCAYLQRSVCKQKRIESHRPHVWLYFNLSFLLLLLLHNSCCVLYEPYFFSYTFFLAYFALKTVN